MYMGQERVIMSILLIYLLVIGVMALGYVVSYVLRGIGMYSLGKKRGMNYPWLAFIPYARTYFQGELCGELAFGERKIQNPGIWMLVIPIAVNVISGAVFAVLWFSFALKLSQSFDGYYSAAGAINHVFSGLGSGILVIGFILMILFSICAAAIQNVLMLLVNHQIFARYTHRNNALLHAGLGLFVPIYTSVYFFLIRNRE